MAQFNLLIIKNDSTAMATQSITQAEFDKYNTNRTVPADNSMSKEVEWWANQDKSAVGSIQIETIEEARKMLKERLES